MAKQLTNIISITTLVALMIGLLLFSACSQSNNPQATETARVSAAPAEAAPVASSNKTQEAKVKRKDSTPIRVAVMLDQSRSATWTRTPQLGSGDLDAVIDLLRIRGGELALGLIRDRSNRGLVRLRVEPPFAEPEKPRAKGNPFDLEKLRADHANDLAVYRKLQLGWQEQTQEKIAKFKTEIAPLLAQKADAGRTDIWGAVTRAELFLSESDAGWPRSTNRYAVFISDGQNTVKSAPVAIKSGAKIILVNGANSPGSFVGIKVNVFESVPAAFQFICASEGEQQ
jgi:hypothetical protein